MTARRKPRKRNRPDRPEFPNRPVEPEQKCRVCEWPKARNFKHFGNDPDYCQVHAFGYEASRKTNNLTKNRENT